TLPSGPMAWFQANAAVSTVNSSRMPVLLTVPLRVMTSPSRVTTAPLPRSRKVDSLSTGLPLRMGRLFRWIGSGLRIHGSPPARGGRVDSARRAPGQCPAPPGQPAPAAGPPVTGRGIAQPGSAPALGAGCRGFESLYPDHRLLPGRLSCAHAPVAQPDRAPAF